MMMDDDDDDGCLSVKRVDTNENSFRGSSGHAFRKSTAGAFGPDLAKKLAQLVKMEKNVMRSMELVGRERREVAVSHSLLFHVVCCFCDWD